MDRQFSRGLDADFDRVAINAQDFDDDPAIDDDAFIELAGQDKHVVNDWELGDGGDWRSGIGPL